MYYEFKWLSDLAVIPAWECFVVGFLAGILITLLVIVGTGGKE